MSQARLLFSLKLLHDWYGATPAPFKVALVGNSARLAQRKQLRMIVKSGIFQIYLTSEDLDELPNDLNLQCEIYSTDPWLYAHTDFGQEVEPDIDSSAETETETKAANSDKKPPLHRPVDNSLQKGKANLHVANVVLTPEEAIREINQTDWEKSGQPGAPLARLAIPQPWNEPPTAYVLRFPTISTYWTYIVDAPYYPDELSIIGDDPDEMFDELESTLSGNGRVLRRFRSVTARQSQRRDLSMYKLISGSTDGNPLVSPLPTPGPNAFARPVQDINALESHIYVTVLTKKGAT